MTSTKEVCKLSLSSSHSNSYSVCSEVPQRFIYHPTVGDSRYPLIEISLSLSHVIIRGLSMLLWPAKSTSPPCFLQILGFCNNRRYSPPGLSLAVCCFTHFLDLPCLKGLLSQPSFTTDVVKADSWIDANTGTNDLLAIFRKVLETVMTTNLQNKASVH